MEHIIGSSDLRRFAQMFSLALFPLVSGEKKKPKNQHKTTTVSFPNSSNPNSPLNGRDKELYIL